MDKAIKQARPTVGAIVRELAQKPFDMGDATPSEIGNEMLSNYETQFTTQLNTGKEKYPNSDFFMEVHLLVPRIFSNHVLQFVMVPRKTLPQPTFDQAVYRYHHISGDISLVWAVPSLEGCVELYENRDILAPELRENLKYVMAFKEGTLFKDTFKAFKQVL